MDILIRRIEKKDYEEVKELLVDLVRSMAVYCPIRREEPASEYKDWYFQRALSYVEQGLGIIGVAEIDGKIVGCIYACVKEQTKDELLEYKKITYGHIPDVFIKEGYRGQGIGKKLLQFAENFLKEKGCDYIELAVRAKNTGAHQLYLELGFEDDLIEMLKKV
jgi:ribosomal protein S18 acetylase RimI-like enzyme